MFISDKTCWDCIEFISQTGALVAGTNKTGRHGWQRGWIDGPSLAADIFAVAVNRTGRLAGPLGTLPKVSRQILLTGGSMGLKICFETFIL